MNLKIFDVYNLYPRLKLTNENIPLVKLFNCIYSLLIDIKMFYMLLILVYNEKISFKTPANYVLIDIFNTKAALIFKDQFSCRVETCYCMFQYMLTC